MLNLLAYNGASRPGSEAHDEHERGRGRAGSIDEKINRASRQITSSEKTPQRISQVRLKMKLGLAESNIL